MIVHDPGATASELQSLIVRPLEGRILTLPDGAGVRSTRGHGTVEIDVRFRQGASAEQDLQAVRTAIDRARPQLPPDVHPPPRKSSATRSTKSPTTGRRFRPMSRRRRSSARCEPVSCLRCAATACR